MRSQYAYPIRCDAKEEIMKKMLGWVCVFVGLLSCAAQAGQMERIHKKGELIVSLNRGYPPFSMEINGKLSGLDVDLAGMIADHLKVKVKFIRPRHYGDQIPKLLAMESDIIIAAMTRTVERGLKVNFTKPYFEVSQAALVNRKLVGPDASSYFDLTEIPGLTLGVKAGTTQEKFARQLFPKEAIKTYPTTEKAIEAVVKGEIDAMAADSPFVRIWQVTHPREALRIKALLEPVTKETYGFAIRKGDPDFLTWLNLFIDQVSSDGTMDLLKYEYFERLSWTGAKFAKVKAPTKAEMLKNKFIQRRQQKLEQLREEQPRGDAYE